MTKDEALKMVANLMETVGSYHICQAAHHSKKDQHTGLEPCPIQQRWNKTAMAVNEAISNSTE